MDGFFDGLPRVVWYSVALSLTTALLFGLIPALHAAKTDVNSMLKDAGRTATGGRRRKSLSAVP